MTEEQIKHMVHRFLGWRLPESFKPDAGITYTPPHGCWSSPPSGTNLLDATQADAMVRYMVEGVPELSLPSQPAEGELMEILAQVAHEHGRGIGLEEWEAAIIFDAMRRVSRLPTQGNAGIVEALNILEEFETTAQDLVLGPPGPHVTKAEKNAWDEAARAKLAILLLRVNLARKALATASSQPCKHCAAGIPVKMGQHFIKPPGHSMYSERRTAASQKGEGE